MEEGGERGDDVKLLGIVRFLSKSCFTSASSESSGVNDTLWNPHYLCHNSAHHIYEYLGTTG